MSTLVQKIKMLSSKITVNEAATGTLYLSCKNISIRIADHEPNFDARRSTDYKEIYTQTLEGVKQNDFQVVERISELLDIEIKGTLKGLFTREFNREMAIYKTIYKYPTKKVQENNIAQRIVQVADISIINKMLSEAEAYGELGANGGKRRKRTVAFFKNAFFTKYNFYATPSDVKEALNL